MTNKLEISRELLSHAAALLSSVHSDVAHQLTALLAAPVVERQCCTPTPEEEQLLANGDYTPEELWGGMRPTCPNCIKPEQPAPVAVVLPERLTSAEL